MHTITCPCCSHKIDCLTFTTDLYGRFGTCLHCHKPVMLVIERPGLDWLYSAVVAISILYACFAFYQAPQSLVKVGWLADGDMTAKFLLGFLGAGLAALPGLRLTSYLAQRFGRLLERPKRKRYWI